MKARNVRRKRSRTQLNGSATRPRVVIFRSNKYFYGQAINDSKGITLASVNLMTDPVKAGADLAKKLLDVKISEIVFDRAGYRYHGNVKKIAEALRGGGLRF